jgi:hypothetical protein
MNPRTCCCNYLHTGLFKVNLDFRISGVTWILENEISASDTNWKLKTWVVETQV